jgi:type IV pilus assembly protein PilA
MKSIHWNALGRLALGFVFLACSCELVVEDHAYIQKAQYRNDPAQWSEHVPSFPAIFLPTAHAEIHPEGLPGNPAAAKGSKSGSRQPSHLGEGLQDVATGLVAHWSFDACNADDSSPFRNNGVIVGSPQCVDGVRGKALRFDGIHDYIQVENSQSLNPADQLTMIAWYRPTRAFAGNGNNAILEKSYISHEVPYYQYHLGVNGNAYSPDRAPRAQGQFDAWIAVDNEPVAVNTSNDFWKPEQWHCLASTFDHESLRLFVNGDPIGKIRHPGRLSDYPTPLTIARNSNLDRGAIDYTPGDIDEVRIYDRALSQRQISQICGGADLSKDMASAKRRPTRTRESEASDSACVGQDCSAAAGRQAVPASGAPTQSVTPEVRLTLVLGALKRSPVTTAPEVAYRQFLDDRVERIPSGTPVLLLGQAVPGCCVGASTDRWYYVSAPKGVFGWAYGGDLVRLDPVYPERAYRSILDRHLADSTPDAASRADLDAFLDRVRAEIPSRLLPRGKGQVDPRRVLSLYADFVGACRKGDPVGKGGGDLPRVESVPPQARIVLASGVRVLPRPQASCGQLARLALGTVVEVSQRTQAKTGLADTIAPWFRVQTPQGATGWVFGGYLYPHDPAHPLLSYGELWEQHLASPPRSLRSELEFLDLLERLRQELPGAVSAEIELARLRGVGRVLSLAFSCNAMPPEDALSIDDAPAIGRYLHGIETYIERAGPAGPLHLSPNAYWALHEHYRGQAVAEHLAWAAAQASGQDPVAARIVAECTEWGEGTDDASTVTEILDAPLDDGPTRYLAAYLQGAHADRALEALMHILLKLEAAADAEPGAICSEGTMRWLRASFDALGPIGGEQAASARTRIASLLASRCPAGPESPPIAIQGGNSDRGAGGPNPSLPPAADASTETSAPVLDSQARIQVAEALVLASQAKVAVAEAYMVTGRFPADNVAAGLPEPSRMIGNYVSALRVADGAIHLELGNYAASGLSGKVLSLRPAVVNDSPGSPISWVCGYLPPAQGMTAIGENRTTVHPYDLPVGCRQPPGQ